MMGRSKKIKARKGKRVCKVGSRTAEQARNGRRKTQEEEKKLSKKQRYQKPMQEGWRRGFDHRGWGEVCGRGGDECLASRVSWLLGDSFLSLYCLLPVKVVVEMIRWWQILFLPFLPPLSLSLSFSSLKALSLLRSSVWYRLTSKNHVYLPPVLEQLCSSYSSNSALL
jgi:hypothetical protein